MMILSQQGFDGGPGNGVGAASSLGACGPRPGNRRVRSHCVVPGRAVLLLCFVCTGLPLRAQEATPEASPPVSLPSIQIDRSIFNPGQRPPEQARANERNPFGLVVKPPAEETEARQVLALSPEDQLRQVLGGMRISGLSGAPGSYNALVGPLVLREGEVLPRIFADQAEMLRVKSINDREIVLVFLERDPDLPKREIVLNVDLKPNVRSMLVGEAFRGLVTSFTAKGVPDVPPRQNPGVEEFLTRTKENIDPLVEPPLEKMGDASPGTDYEAAPPSTP